MAEQYAFGDRMFESNQGPSFPAHLYIISGTSRPDSSSTLDIAENPRSSMGHSTGGCDSPPGSLVALIDQYGNENDYTYPCVSQRSILDLLYEKHHTWHYYQAHKGAGLWNAADAVRQIRRGSGYETNVLYPPTQFFKDVNAGRMADVSIVTPTADNSDHAGITNRTGPSWVASVVNSVGKTAYWRDTAIFVVWDDWGGWYDHVAPPMYNSYELGMRVPLIVISPYTPAGYVSHAQHEFGSILKFIEEDFGLGSLGTTDARADDLTDCFDFQQKPRRFVHINAPRTQADFLRSPGSTADVDY
jgi:phospholipase C